MGDLVPSTRLANSPIDSRVSGRYPIAQSVTFQLQVADGEGGAASPVSFTGKKVPHGQIVEIVVSAPAIPTDATFDLEIKDADGVSLHNETGITDNQVSRIDIITSNVLVSSAIEFEIEFATALSGDTALFDVYLKTIDPNVQ